MTKIRIALLQMAVDTNKSVNIEHASLLISEAKEKGALVVVLPECFNSPYGNKYFDKYAEEIPKGETCQALSKAAKKNKVFLVGGSIPERDGKNLHNTCTIWGPDGTLINKFRKIHLFDMDVENVLTFKESDSLTPGNDICVFDIPQCKLGVGICWDMRFPDLASFYRDQGVDVLLYPGAFDKDLGLLHWEVLLRARALDNQVYVAGICGAQDIKADYITWGHTMLVDPWGRVVTQAEFDETLLIADIDLDVCKAARKQIPIRYQTRSDVYGILTKNC